MAKQMCLCHCQCAFWCSRQQYETAMQPMHRRNGWMPPPMSQCAHCVTAGGSKRCTSLCPATYEESAVEYRSRRCSSLCFCLSHTFQQFFSHSCAPFT